MIKLGPAGAGVISHPSKYDEEDITSIWDEDYEKPISWDEKGRSKIIQIFVSYDDSVHTIQFQYVDDETGALRMSAQHGDHTGINFHAVILDYPSEYITCVRGNYKQTGGPITSITFDTNMKTYGPFGARPQRDCKDFCFNVGPNFGGFHGSMCYGYLDSIGVYLKPATTLNSLKKVKDEKIPITSAQRSVSSSENNTQCSVSSSEKIPILDLY